MHAIRNLGERVCEKIGSACGNDGSGSKQVCVVACMVVRDLFGQLDLQVPMSVGEIADSQPGHASWRPPSVRPPSCSRGRTGGRSDGIGSVPGSHELRLASNTPDGELGLGTKLRESISPTQVVGGWEKEIRSRG